MLFSYSLANSLSLLSVLCGGAVALYRLYLHPLANFPGPWLAAITDYYAAYYNIWMAGGQVKQLEKLHHIYGPVVRIRPNQLHFKDPEAFDTIYGSYSRLTKFPPFYDSFHNKESSFGFVDPRLAKERRDALSPFFLRTEILKHENVIQSSVDRLVDALTTYTVLYPHPANLHLALNSTTMEIVASYCLGHPFNTLCYRDFNHPALTAFLSAAGAYFFLQHFPFFIPLAFHLPDWLKGPEMLAVGNIFKGIEGRVDGFLAGPSTHDGLEHKTIFHHLLGQGDGQMRPSRRSLLDEASAMTATGSDPVANACSLGIFQVLSNPNIRTRLVTELTGAWPEEGEPIGVEKLESLLYLTAVIKESLRLSHGFVSPLPRVTQEDMLIAKRFVPAGTVVAMGHSFIHNNPELFRDPSLFDPNRWMEDESKELEKYLVAFSRGPRMCLGMTLAWCELYLIFGNLFRKFDLEIHETTMRDFDFMAYLTPVYLGHLRVLVKEAH